MESSNQFLGTERIGKLMQKYAIPCIISLLVGALYNIVDQIFIANASYLGSYGNAANTVVFPLTVVFSLLIQTLRLQHLSADAYCNHYGCSLLLGYAAFNCSPGCLISFNIFDASYLIPLVRIAWNTLISLHATAISDCIFFNGFFSLVV